MANTSCNSIGNGSDFLMRCSQPEFLSNPLNGRELRRQAKRDRKREAKQDTKRKGFG